MPRRVVKQGVQRPMNPDGLERSCPFPKTSVPDLPCVLGSASGVPGCAPWLALVLAVDESCEYPNCEELLSGPLGVDIPLGHNAVFCHY
jgi:hypothetical protein